MAILRYCSLLILFSLCIDAFAEVPFPERLDGQEFSGVLARSGNVFISAQPTEKGLASLKSQGVTTVVNLRTDEEMSGSVPFDEAGTVRDLGMTYVHLPAGGKQAPYTPATLEKFAAALDRADGNVLLHCRSAGRASHLWVAYLVKYKGLSMEDAIAQGRAINFGSTPLEGFLKGEVEYHYVPTSP